MVLSTGDHKACLRKRQEPVVGRMTRRLPWIQEGGGLWLACSPPASSAADGGCRTRSRTTRRKRHRARDVDRKIRRDHAPGDNACGLWKGDACRSASKGIGESQNRLSSDGRSRLAVGAGQRPLSPCGQKPRLPPCPRPSVGACTRPAQPRLPGGTRVGPTIHALPAKRTRKQVVRRIEKHLEGNHPQYEINRAKASKAKSITSATIASPALPDNRKPEGSARPRGHQVAG